MDFTPNVPNLTSSSNSSSGDTLVTFCKYKLYNSCKSLSPCFFAVSGRREGSPLRVSATLGAATLGAATLGAATLGAATLGALFCLAEGLTVVFFIVAGTTASAGSGTTASGTEGSGTTGSGTGVAGTTGTVSIAILVFFPILIFGLDTVVFLLSAMVVYKY